MPLTPASSVKCSANLEGLQEYPLMAAFACSIAHISTEARQKASMGFGDDGIHQ